jgi:paraquat-inducible protein A
MDAAHNQIKQQACHECDLLITLPNKLEDNQSLLCPRCKHVQWTKHKNPIDKTLAISLTALMLLIIANAFPFLSFEAQGQARSITLIQASNELAAQGFYLLAFLVYVFVLLFPAIYLACLLALALPIKLGIPAPMGIMLGRTLSYLLPWIMTEVFIVGVLVALIKIIELADIVFGIAFWAYIVFVICFLTCSNVANKHQIWSWISHGK